MTKRDTILVLEDAEDRVTWLKKIVEPLGYTVNWCLDVREFLQEAEGIRDELALLVFDHDLGHAGPQQSDAAFDAHLLIKYDQDGRCGLDAARMLGSHPIPAVVWSWNRDGRMAIANEIGMKGKVTKVFSAAFVASEDYAHQIKRLLR